MTKLLVGTALLAMLTSQALGHSEESHGDAESFVPANLDMVENAFGHTGDPDSIDRTVEVSMNDEMRFSPDEVRVTVGDTVRFMVTNEGETLHEMVIGRAEDLKEHAELMEQFPNMEHAEPFMVHANEGQTAEMLWTFSEPGTFEYGCLIPGHYDAGMRGVIVVAAASDDAAAPDDVVVWTSGEVRKVDMEQGKVTVRHDEITNLDMPPMTMVFTVSDPALLDGLEAGDTREFHFVDQNGRMVIEGIRVPE